jgi:hypothetical protein
MLGAICTLWLVNINELRTLKAANNGSGVNTRSMHASNDSIPSNNTKRLDIICRTYHNALFELMQMVFTYLLFFPKDELSSHIILVFDAESELDHVAGSVLETAYKTLGVKVFFEEPPPPGTLTSRVRSEGFSRTQWSNFYSDLYSDADFIGMIDSDTEFSFRGSLSKHLILEGERPIIHGIRSGNQPVVKFMLGVEMAAEFMYVFPFVVKREHFAMMRAQVVQATGYATFEQAWFHMQNQYDSWGQFIIMGNYLFHFHHDEYAWDVVGTELSTVPTASPHFGKNLPTNTDVEQTLHRYHDQMCVQSRGIASECKAMTPEAVEMAKFVPFTDYWPTANGVAGYNYADSKAHDGAAPRDHNEVFDEVMEEVFAHKIHGEFWLNTRYDAANRTRQPA